MEKVNLRNMTIFGIIFLTIVSRIIPHIPNFTPMGAISLFGATYFKKKWQVFIIPILTIWLSDIFVNLYLYSDYSLGFIMFYNGFYWQYISYVLITLIGTIILNKPSILNITIANLLAVIVFFVISNFGSWIAFNMYPKTFEGLVTCYLAGIPFIKGNLLGNLFYSFFMFGSFSILMKKYPILGNANIEIQ